LPLLDQRRHMLEAMLEAIQSAPAHPGSLGLLLERQSRLLQSDSEWMDELMERLNNLRSL
jgi:hypothetical protein